MNRSTQLLLIGWSLVFASCSGDDEGTPYTLCDGSDEIRLAVESAGGGFAPASTAFTHPLGWRFLFVTGRCTYLAGGDLTQGLYEGTLSPSEAQRIERELKLAQLPAWSSHEDLSCPDASGHYVRSLEGYAMCACGCDDNAPRGLASALDAAFARLDELTSSEQAQRQGPVEIVVIRTPEDTSEAQVAWPFAFPIEEVVVSNGRFGGKPFEEALRVLNSDDTEVARGMLSAARKQDGYADHVVVNHDEDLYALYIRDQLPSTWVEAIEAFKQSAPKP